MDRLTPDALPRSLIAWPAFLWSRVLFPGDRPAAAEPIRLISLLILLFLPALLLYPCLSFALFEPDESRYAEVPREMLQRGDWVTPRLDGEPYLEKPPLLYWLTAVSYEVFGVHDWAARLPPALAVHGTILLVYFFGRRIFGERAAFRGALVLSLAPGFVAIGRLLLIDGVLTFCTTLALFAAFEAVRGGRLRWGWWLLAAVACGLGVLAKGPVALVLLAGPLALHRWLTARPLPLTRGAVAAFLGVAVGLTLPWYAALCLRVPRFRLHLLLGAQRPAFPDAVRPRTRRLVLRAGAAARAAAGVAAARAVSTLFGIVGRGDRPATAARTRLPAAGRRLVRAVLHAVGEQAADVHPAGFPAFGARHRMVLDEHGLGPLALAGRRCRRRVPAAGRLPKRRRAVVRRLPFADAPAGRGAPPLRRPLRAGRLLPARMRLRRLLPRPRRRARLPQQGH